MIENNTLYDYLTAKGYPENSLIYRIFTDLSNLGVLAIRKAGTPEASVFIKFSKNKNETLRINSIVEEYFDNLSTVSMESFPPV